MEHTLHEFKEMIHNAVDNLNNVTLDSYLSAQLHSVVVFWISPIEPFLCHRQGWFDEYVEAEQFGMKLFEEEKALGFETALYIGGNLTKHSEATRK